MAGLSLFGPTPFSGCIQNPAALVCVPYTFLQGKSELIHKRFDIIGIPERPAKPRQVGITMMLDKGLSAREATDKLAVCSEYIDVVKLGWGTAVITPQLGLKLEAYSTAGLPVFFGGTLFEAFYVRNQLDTYKSILHEFGIGHVEISDGSIDIPREVKLGLISDFARDFHVFSEVGSKDVDTIMPPYQWVDQIMHELDAGSSKVICEARESGTVGLFRPNGEVRSGLVDEIVDLIGKESVIFEAPRKAQQVWFLKKFGPNVNLGNILPEEVIPLETLRLGLRADTLFDFLEPGGDRPN